MDKSKHRILIVTSEFPPQPGGIGNHAYNLAKHLQLSHFKVNVISDQRSEEGEEEAEFDQALSFKVYRVPKTKFRFWMYLKRLQLVFKQVKTADTVMASGKFSLWVVGFASLFFKRQYIAIIHGSEVNYQKKLLQYSIEKSLQRFTKVIAVSHYTQSLVAHLGLKDLSVIPNGIDPKDWDLNTIGPIDLKGSPRLLTVGRLSDRKGQLEVIQHLSQLIEVYPELHYHCVGIAAEGSRFLAIAEQLGVASYVTFHGPKSQAELMAFYQSCDVFVMLSRSTENGDVEGFGIAILEANALGVPAIGAKGSGIEDAIQHDVTGFLIDPKDAQAFESALKQLLAHKEVFSKQAKAWAEAHDWKLIIDRYVGVMSGDG